MATKAEKCMETGPLSVELSTNNGDVKYVAEFKPGHMNPLWIEEDDEDNDPYSDCIFLPHESAVKLAKFLKELFLDEDSEGRSDSKISEARKTSRGMWTYKKWQDF